MVFIDQDNLEIEPHLARPSFLPVPFSLLAHNGNGFMLYWTSGIERKRQKKLFTPEFYYKPVPYQKNGKLAEIRIWHSDLESRFNMKVTPNGIVRTISLIFEHCVSTRNPSAPNFLQKMHFSPTTDIWPRPSLLKNMGNGPESWLKMIQKRNVGFTIFTYTKTYPSHYCPFSIWLINWS